MPEAKGLRVKRVRTQFTHEQLDCMEDVFSKTQYPDVTVLESLASDMDLGIEKVCTWFQNRRSKFRKENKRGHIALMRQQIVSKPLAPEDVVSVLPIVEANNTNSMPASTDVPIKSNNFRQAPLKTLPANDLSYLTEEPYSPASFSSVPDSTVSHGKACYSSASYSSPVYSSASYSPPVCSSASYCPSAYGSASPENYMCLNSSSESSPQSPPERRSDCLYDGRDIAEHSSIVFPSYEELYSFSYPLNSWIDSLSQPITSSYQKDHFSQESPVSMIYNHAYAILDSL